MPYFRSHPRLRRGHDPHMMLETPMSPAAPATLPLWPMPERLEMERGKSACQLDLELWPGGIRTLSDLQGFSNCHVTLPKTPSADRQVWKHLRCIQKDIKHAITARS